MIRRKERRGAKEFKGFCEDTSALILSRAGAWKREGLLRFVMSSVFDGGDGCINAGREEKSSDSGELSPRRFNVPFTFGGNVGDTGGDMMVAGIIIAVV